MELKPLSNGVRYTQGYECSYLGFVPCFKSKGSESIRYCVEKILDNCNAREALIRKAFVEVYATILLVYFVDSQNQVVESKSYDLTRISFCEAHPAKYTDMFTWIYRQEIDTGFQLECHAVRFQNSRTAQIVARKMFAAFHKMQGEIKSAIEFGETFFAAKSSIAEQPPRTSGSFLANALKSVRKRSSKRSSGSSEGKGHGSRSQLGSEILSQDNLAYTTGADICGSIALTELSNPVDCVDLEDNVFIG